MIPPDVACQRHRQYATLLISGTVREGIPMTIGDIISTGRKRAGLTQRELAARILKEDGTPISPPYLNDIERDRRNAPSPHLLKQFAEILRLSYDYLLFLAGDLPDDLRNGTYAPEDVEAAFQAFRQTLKDRSETPG